MLIIFPLSFIFSRSAAAFWAPHSKRTQPLFILFDHFPARKAQDAVRRSGFLATFPSSNNKLVHSLSHSLSDLFLTDKNIPRRILAIAYLQDAAVASVSLMLLASVESTVQRDCIGQKHALKHSESKVFAQNWKWKQRRPDAEFLEKTFSWQYYSVHISEYKAAEYWILKWSLELPHFLMNFCLSSSFLNQKILVRAFQRKLLLEKSLNSVKICFPPKLRLS